MCQPVVPGLPQAFGPPRPTNASAMARRKLDFPEPLSPRTTCQPAHFVRANDHRCERSDRTFLIWMLRICMSARGTGSMGNHTSLRRGDADRSDLHADAVGQMYAKRRAHGWKAHRHEVGADEARSSRTPRCRSIDLAVYSALTGGPWGWKYAFNVRPCWQRGPSAVRPTPDSRISDGCERSTASGCTGMSHNWIGSDSAPSRTGVSGCRFARDRGPNEVTGRPEMGRYGDSVTLISCAIHGTSFSVCCTSFSACCSLLPTY